MRISPRFVRVGAVATAVDLALTRRLTPSGDDDLPGSALGDLAAVSVATAVSALGHRATLLGDDPTARWYRRRNDYGATAIAAATVDSAVFTYMVSRGRPRTVAKAVSLQAAFLVRLAFYRRAMFQEVRGDQATPAHQVPSGALDAVGSVRPGVEPSPGTVRLSVVVPAYGEEDGIGATVDRLRSELASVSADGGLEVVVVDDGSPDDTAGAARRAGADQVIRLDPNQGKGGAVRAGMMAANGRTIAFTDADLSYAPHQIAGLLERVEEGWDVVVGSRRHHDTTTLVAAGRLREIGGRVINVLTMLVLLGQYRDTQCGLKAFRSDAARRIFGASTIDGFAFDVEVFHLVERYRLSLLEVPVELSNSTRSTVHVVRDAGRLVRDLFAIRRAGRAGVYGNR